MDKTAQSPSPGTLYVVATPIGNLQDITLRALDILQTVDLIAAEDTRRTGRLLKNVHPQGRLVSYHEHNEKRRTPFLIAKLEAGLSVAVVSDAGTPSVSDPGFRLVQSAIARGIRVAPIPGASAAVTALSVSGLSVESFVFIGFPPKKQNRRIKELEALRDAPRTLIFYESPRRVTRLVEDMLKVMGDRSAVLGREMTKLHEEFLRGPLSGLLRNLKARPEVKGECTLVVSGADREATAAAENLKDHLTNRLKQKKIRFSELVRETVRETGLPKKIVYAEALKIKKALAEEDN